MDGTMKRLLLCSLFLLLLATPRPAQAQHLWWRAEDPGKPQEKRTLLYGEVEVIASEPGIYFCGVNWSGGYCGIQEHAENKRNTIFSLWDTSPTLHPSVVQADARAVCKRFGGEGTGEHTDLDYPWQLGKPFRFAVSKEPDRFGENTLVTFYFFDASLNHWVLQAALSAPNGDKDSVRYFLRPNMNSFLENFAGRQLELPKLCLYRLWAGTAPENLVFLRKAKGDGPWGVLNDSFYLAQGKDPAALDALLARQPKSRDSQIGWIRGAKAPLTVPDRKLPADTIAALKALPKPNPSAAQKSRPLR
jgi:hypothetical protein